MGPNQPYHFADKNFTLMATVSVREVPKAGSSSSIPLTGVKLHDPGHTVLFCLSYTSENKWEVTINANTRSLSGDRNWVRGRKYQVALGMDYYVKHLIVCVDGLLMYDSEKDYEDNEDFFGELKTLAQPATSTWCQGLVLFAREEAKRLLPIRCTRRGRRRRTNGSEGHQMEPFTCLPAERYFYPLLNSIGAHQRYTYRLRAVFDAQRQKLLLSGDIEQNPGPIAVLQMNVSCLTPSKLATLMAQEADIIAIQETWKSSEQIASMHTGDYVLHAQSR
ncbi:trans-sialidase, partial [Trypanosoma cruzi]